MYRPRLTVQFAPDEAAARFAQGQRHAYELTPDGVALVVGNAWYLAGLWYGLWVRAWWFVVTPPVPGSTR